MTETQLRQRFIDYKAGRLTLTEAVSGIKDGSSEVAYVATKSADEIIAAHKVISNNPNLTYGYKDDVLAVLDWVLTGVPFDGLLEEG